MDDALDETVLPLLLDRFYAQVRADALLGPVFESVNDWPAHLTALRDFWSSVMLGTGRYKGNPIARHAALADQIEPAMFVRWLDIWAHQTSSVLPAQIAWQMQMKAEKIAANLLRAIEHRAT